MTSRPNRPLAASGAPIAGVTDKTAFKCLLVLGALLWFLRLLGGSSALAEEDGSKPILVLDAGGHTANVNGVLFGADGQQLITVSDDKTIRFWELASGQTLRVLRPQVGRGPEGKHHALAISSNGRTLAVSGYGFPTARVSPIYLIALPGGTIERVLTGHRDAVHALAFRPHSTDLASASSDKTARLWNSQTGQCERVFEGHQAEVFGLAFSPDGKRLATAGFDRTARIWSLEDGRCQATLAGHEAELRAVAWSPDGRTIVTGSRDCSIRLWNPDGTARQPLLKLESAVMSVHFGEDPRTLLATLRGTGGRGFYADVYDLEKGRRSLRFERHTNSVHGGAFSPDGMLAATCGGNEHETYLWKTSDGSVVRKFAGQGSRVWNCAWNTDGHRIAWGHTYRFQSPNNLGPLERAFDLSRLEFVDSPGEQYRRAQESRDGLRLKMAGAGSLLVTQGDQTRTKIRLDPKEGSLKCFTFLSADRACVATAFRLRLFDTQTGRLVRTFLGHTGAVWAVAPSPDGRYFLTASSDQTLRIWDPQREEPVLSLFFAGQEWIAWTPEGYYAASPGGERLIGWQVNNGLKQMASYYPAAQFRKSLYRPDVVRLLLQSGDTSKALAVADPGGGRATQLTRADEVLPPEVIITAPSPSPVHVDQARVELHAKAAPKGRDPITGLRVLVDGRPYVELKHSDPAVKPVTASWPLVLEPGTHKVTVKADTGKSYGLSHPVEITYVSKGSTQELPSLYVLAIGISEYEDQKLRLAYGAADARGLAETLQKKAAGVYRKVQANVILDVEATQRNILRGLDWLRKQMTQRDVGVVFFAGHGAKDDQGSFYLLPADCKPDELAIAGVGEDQIKRFCQSIPGRLILLLDACHTGALGGDRRRAIGGLTDNLVRDLISDDYGLVVMCSSMGREESREQDDWGHGAFTKALIEGLEGNADYNRDRSIYLNELDLYVAERVKELTGGHQHPVTQKPTSIRNFPLTRP